MDSLNLDEQCSVFQKIAEQCLKNKTYDTGISNSYLNIVEHCIINKFEVLK